MIVRKIKETFIDLLTSNSKNKRIDNVINIHRVNTKNAGDLTCAPYLYFDELKNKEKIDINGYLSGGFSDLLSWSNNIKSSNMVIGGGGLLDRESFKHAINLFSKLNKKQNKVVLWGVGHNNPTLKASKSFYKQVKGFDLVGVRDYGTENVDWVPCVSCMNTVFDKEYVITQEIGVVEHEHIPIPGADGLNFPSLKNKATFDEIINFIGKTELLITNSYHVMYWSILMNRKVLVVPNSSKMTSFKYKVPLIEEASLYKNYLNNTTLYNEALDDCREHNILFSKKVFNYLDLY